MICAGRLWPVFLLSASLLVLGCNPPGPAGPPASQAHQAADHDDDHDGHEHGDEHEHEHHESYTDAVRELDGLRLAAKNALADNNLKAADEAVHEIGHILEELPALADKEIAAADDKVKPAIHDLYVCFDKIDQKIHGDVGKTYDEMAAQIDAGMETLRREMKTQEK
jgi:hypothetical protein